MESTLKSILKVLDELAREIIAELRRDEFSEVLRYVGVTSPVTLETEKSILRGYYISNTNASARYLKIYDSDQPVKLGTNIPRLTICIPGNNAVTANGLNIKFSTGITLAATTGASDIDATPASANEIVVNLFIQ